MSWNPITTANIHIQPAEAALLANISGSSTVCQEILTTVVGEFVEAIQQGGNQFATDGTIPDVARPHVIARTRWLWLCEFPEIKRFQTAERSKLNDEAVAFRDRIASGNPKIAPPSNPDAISSAPIVTMPSSSCPKLKRFRWCEENGI